MCRLRLAVGFCILWAALCGCAASAEQSSAGQTEHNGVDALLTSPQPDATGQDQDVLAPRPADAGWAGACEAVANSRFYSVKPQYVGGPSPGMGILSIWFEDDRARRAHWLQTDNVHVVKYKCDGFDILTEEDARTIGHFNAKSDILIWDMVDYARN